MGHSLNFSGRMRYGASSCTSASYGCWATANYPGIYDRFVENGSGQSILDTGLFPNLSAALGSQLTGGNLYFDGTNANAANGGSPVKIYAPGTWSSGSSYSHLDYSTYVGTANRLMVYSISSNSSIHDPGAITLGMFKDMGWNKYSQSITVNTQAPASKTLDGTFTVNASASSGLGITYSASGGCTNSGADFTMTSSIVNCVVSYTQAGDTDYNAATTVTETVSAVCNNAQTVTTNGDSGAGSLRQALREACGSGAITFDSSLSGGTITHSSAVTIDRNVTLNGALLSSPVGLVFTDLTINSGTTLDTGTNELTVSGTLTNNGVLKHTTPSQNVTTGGGTVAFEDARGIVTTQIQSTGTNNLGSTNIVVQANNAPASCGVNRFTSNMVLRQFNLTPTNTSSIAATVRLYFAPGELNSLDAGSLKMYHCNGTAWEKLDGTYTYGTDGASGYAYVELPGVTSFSPFALGPNDAPTGAQLVAFRARYVNTKNRVAVKWQTGSELNLVGFNVWHRVNGGAWKIVNAAPIAAKQLGNIRGANYRRYDKNLKSGKTYQYKLELLTTHGSTWSNVVKLKIP